MQEEPLQKYRFWPDYVDALTRSCVFEDLGHGPRGSAQKPPYGRVRRAISAIHRLRSQPWGNQRLKSSWKIFETFGLLFESMCIRDLRTYMDLLGGKGLPLSGQDRP